MLQNITLKNFQGHKHTDLSFVPGINAIVGSSDNGKTSILRAIRWAYNNRPLGDDFVSHWNITEKGKLLGESATTLVFNCGGLTRIKNPTRNGYTIGDIELGAIGTDVPEEVTTLFNMTDLNFQDQDDRPFLISESAGDVAKYLNKLVKLDKIDVVLAEIASRKKANKALHTDTEGVITKLNRQITELAWVEKGRELLGKAEQLEKKIRGSKEKQERLATLIAECRARKAEQDGIESKKQLVRKADRLAEEIVIVIKEEQEARLKNNSEKLEMLIKNAKWRKKDIEREQKEYDALEKELPAICPTCRRPLCT